MMESNCKDCKFYLPVDVFSGMCKVSGLRLLPDQPFCPEGALQPRCRHCSNFRPGKEHLGTCGETTLAYPDMNASKCSGFSWQQMN